jgi:hypothetical protein
MSLEQQIINELAHVIGPAAPSFLKRQCAFHLKKDSSALTKADVEEISKWIFVGIKLILDESTAGQLKSRIMTMN